MAERSPSSSPASVDAALHVLDSMLREDDGAEADESPMGDLLLPSFDARGAFASYERREGSHETPPSAHGAGRRGGKPRVVATRRQAMEQFVTDPSEMHWEDLVKAMKRKKRHKGKRGRRNAKGSHDNRNYADGLSTVEESLNENGRGRSLDGDAESIDFFPELSSSLGPENDDAEEGPSSRSLAQRHADEGDDRSDDGGTHRPRRGSGRRSLACAVLLFLVGLLLGIVGTVKYEERVALRGGSLAPDGDEEAMRDVALDQEAAAEGATGGWGEVFGFTEEDLRPGGWGGVFPFDEADAENGGGDAAPTADEAVASAASAGPVPKDEGDALDAQNESAVGPVELHLRPSALATVQRSHPDATDGGALTLSVYGRHEERRSFVRFDLSSLSMPHYGARAVANATLVLHLTSKHVPGHGAAVAIDMFPEGGDWASGTVSWNEPIEDGGRERVASVHVAGAEEDVEADVTSAVLREKDGVTFGLSTEADVRLDFASVSWYDGGLAPKLVVVLTD